MSKIFSLTVIEERNNKKNLIFQNRLKKLNLKNFDKTSGLKKLNFKNFDKTSENIIEKELDFWSIEIQSYPDDINPFTCELH